MQVTQDTLRDSGWLRGSSSLSRGRAKGLKNCMYFPGTPRADSRVLDEIDRAHALEERRMREKNRLDSGWDVLESKRSSRSKRALGERRKRRGPHPAVVGALLVFCPPMGLALLWASPRYSREAQIAITLAMSVFALCSTLLVVLLS